ncbi:hypothetical protein GCM10020258_02480 [Sphingomonas yabuuchiae]
MGNAMVTIREAGAGDRAAVATMLGRAFADDPAMSYIFPDAADRAKRLPRLFALLFDSDAVGMRLVSEAADAGTFWRPPGQAHVPMAAYVRRLILVLHALGASLPRAMRLGDAIEAHFPREPFWYLHIAGVDPARQGRGWAVHRYGRGWPGAMPMAYPPIWRRRPRAMSGFIRGWASK